MSRVRPYEVTLDITGPVKINEEINFITNKELNIGEIFDSNVRIIPDEGGFKIIVTVFTSDQSQANKIALLFVGRMLDILSIKINSPLFVSLFSDWKYVKLNNQKAVLSRFDFQSSFQFSRVQDDLYSTFLRGLSWRRKALYTEDPYDKFFSLWLSIEVIANKLNPNNENCLDQKTGRHKGSICNIWECFKYLWGECDNWDIIKSQPKWIDENASIRNKIGHGTFAVDVRSIDEVLHKLPTLNSVSYKFLLDWALKYFDKALDN